MILAGNYGEAGALDLYGPEYGLPRVITGANSLWARGYGDPAPETAIVVGFDRPYAGQFFKSCEPAWLCNESLRGEKRGNYLAYRRSMSAASRAGRGRRCGRRCSGSNRKNPKVDKTMEKQRAHDGITGGLLLVGLGVLLLTGWWWPGIMVVLGIAIGAGLVFRGRYLAGVVMAAIFFSIPLLTKTDIPWNIFGPMILIGIGVVVLVKAFVLREE